MQEEATWWSQKRGGAPFLHIEYSCSEACCLFSTLLSFFIYSFHRFSCDENFFPNERISSAERSRRTLIPGFLSLLGGPQPSLPRRPLLFSWPALTPSPQLLWLRFSGCKLNRSSASLESKDSEGGGRWRSACGRIRPDFCLLFFRLGITLVRRDFKK